MDKKLFKANWTTIDGSKRMLLLIQLNGDFSIIKNMVYVLYQNFNKSTFSVGSVIYHEH